MHVTVARSALVKLIEQMTASPFGPRSQGDPLRIWTSGARLCVAANGVVAGTEALVLRSGHCCTQRTRFLQLLKSYSSKKNLTFELVGHGLRFGSSTVDVTEVETGEEVERNYSVVPTLGKPRGRERGTLLK